MELGADLKLASSHPVATAENTREDTTGGEASLRSFRTWRGGDHTGLKCRKNTRGKVIPVP